MKTTCLTIVFLSLFQITFATTIIVDKNGAGQFTKIQDGINAANPNDTVIVWPGTYIEQLTLNKNIVLQGSGYENTIITGNYDATIVLSAGKLKWCQISSTGSVGIKVYGGIVSNCVISSCPYSGVRGAAGTTAILNCIFYNNGQHGVSGSNSIICILKFLA